MAPRLLLLSGAEAAIRVPEAGESVRELRWRLAAKLGCQPERVLLTAGRGILPNEEDVSQLEGVVQVVLRSAARKVFVAEAGASRVSCWTSGLVTGSVVAGLGLEGARAVSNPRCIALDAEGRLYVAEAGEDRVTCWTPGDPNGMVVAGGRGAGPCLWQLNTPCGLVVSEGVVYVAEYWNHRVTRWRPGSASGELVAGASQDPGSSLSQLINPCGLCMDKLGFIYVAENGNHRVTRWSQNPQPGDAGLVVAGGNGLGEGLEHLRFPCGVAVADDGCVFVADSRNHRVCRWAPGAKAGTVVAGGNGFGTDRHQLSFPYGIHVDEQQVVYVTEELNDRVTRWEPGTKEGEVVVGGSGEKHHLKQIHCPYGVFVD